MILPGFIRNRIDLLKKKTLNTANNTLETFIKGGILFLFCVTIIWVSIFLYVVFYYTYVPSIEHVNSVNLQFTPCDSNNSDMDKGVCSFPRAHVQLTKSNQLLMVGQPYKITLVLEVPESNRNKELGMFLVCGQLTNKGGVTIAHSCRATMLRYRSPLVHMLTVLALSPFYVSNLLEEKQILQVELFSNFEEDQIYPVTDIYIEIQSELIEVYSSKLQIDAHLSGIRYLMFHWPAVSAAFGVSFNLAVIAFIVSLSWWQLYGPYPVSGREFLFSKLREKFSPSPERRLSDVEPLEDYDDADDDPTILKLKDSFEEEENGERKFVLERKMSSSEA
uniref:Seipin n=1 Tax=Triatoma infestans TaxID=30076 RepID=A0A023FA80_TRIIF